MCKYWQDVSLLRTCATCPPHKHKWQGVQGLRGFRQPVCVLLRKCHLHYKYRHSFRIIGFKGQLSRVSMCCTQVIIVSVYRVVFCISHDPVVFSSANRNSQIHTITLLGIIIIIFHFKSPRRRQINLFKVTVDIELGSICLYSKKSSGKWSHKIMSWCVRDMHLQVKDMVQMTLLGSGPLCIHRKIGPAVGCLVLLSVFAESIVL